MRLSTRSRSLVGLGLVLMLTLLTLAACGGGGNSSAATIIIGSKKDTDSQLQGTMYALLLKQKGFNVKTQIPLGDTSATQAAIHSGNIDIYPEFTGTALSGLSLKTTGNPQNDYQAIKSAWDSKYHETWLTPAYDLNDSYALCTTPAIAQQYNLKTIDDVAAQNGKLILTSQTDALNVVDKPLEQAYGITFKKIVFGDEQSSFDAVKNGTADLNICYTTDPQIQADGFVELTDTKDVFGVYSPAPVVRDSILSANPSIADTLNALAPHVTTQKITPLLQELSTDKTKTVQGVAESFLKSEGLLR